MPSVLVELISGDMVESYRREAALDGKGGRGWSPAHTTPKSARGQSRRFDHRPATSGLPRSTDIARPAGLVRFVPGSDMQDTQQR
jgi:hypothetical protein